MFKLFGWALLCLRSLARDRSDLVLENMALRHQVLLLQRQCRTPKSKPADRLLWSILSRHWPGWKNALLLFRPETVIGWQKRVFRFYWRWRSRPKGGRPRIDPQVAKLIRRMWEANPTWGAPRIRDELATLGLPVATATVRQYRPKVCRPSGQTWKTFLENHLKEVIAIDFFVVPTVTFRLLYGFIVLAHDRRRVLHFAVTESPSAHWAGQQLVNAFPFQTPPKYLLRDRDSIYGAVFTQRVRALGMKELKIAPRSPWQNPYVERLIGTVRRECLDQLLILNAAHLHRALSRFFDYYHRVRPHRSLDHDAPVSRPVEAPERGEVIELPVLGGLHHRYSRRAA
jgi:transposase InsO family protein